MLNFLSKKLFGSSNDRLLKKIYPLVQQTNDLEAKYQKLSDEDLIKKTSEFKEQIQKGKKIDDFLNLGKPDRLSTEGMTKEEKDEFLKMLSILLKKGIVGYEVLEVDGKPEKHFIVNQIGNQRIYGAELYKNKSYFKDKLDY